MWKKSSDDDYSDDNQIVITDPTKLTGTISNLTNGTEYKVEAVARNDAGDSNPSAEQKATPAAASAG